MCFAINKDYAGELIMERMNNESITVGKLENSPAEIADHVAVHESGVKSVVNNGQGSALVVTAMTPQTLGDNKMNAKANLVQIVSRCVDKVLKEHADTETSQIVLNEDKRMDIAMEVSECCGAKLKEHESVICSVCNEHTNGIEQERESIHIKEFNWSQYQQDIVNNRIKKHGTIKNAIITMDAQIASLEVEVDALKEMVEWDEEE